MKIRIIDDTLSDQDLGHNIPIGTITEGGYEDDGHMYAPVPEGHVIILEGEYEIIEEEL